MVILRLTFQGTARLFPTGAVLFHIPTTEASTFQFLRILAKLGISHFFAFHFFDHSHSDGCGVLPHCGFDVRFPSDE